MSFFTPPPRNSRSSPDQPVASHYVAYAPKPVTSPSAVPTEQKTDPVPESPPVAHTDPPMTAPAKPPVMPPPMKPPVMLPVDPPKPPVKPPVLPPPVKPPVKPLPPPEKPPEKPPVKPPVILPEKPPEKPACPESVCEVTGCGLTLGMCAPQFKANSTFGPICLADYRGKWVILFSHPGDFTPVCTTEFMAFSQAWADFKDLNTQLLGLSVDSNASHLAWVMNIYRNTGVEVPFPIIEDRSMRIAKMYCMIHPGVSDTSTVRSVFFIDPDQKIRAILQYPLTNGRNIQEILRLLVALQTTDRCKIATPANWVPGEPVIVPAPQTWKGVQERQDEGFACIDWYLCFKSIDK